MQKVKIFLIKIRPPRIIKVYFTRRKDFAMKKKIVFLLFILPLILCACSPKPNMETLLAYQRAGTEMTLCITDTETFRARLTITEADVTLTFTDKNREGISYRMDGEGNLFMFFEDTEIPLLPSDELKCKEWLSLFRIPSGDNIWKIKKETVGGIAVYVCRDERITLYIDAASLLPLKIEYGRITIDILSCETEQTRPHSTVG